MVSAIIVAAGNSKRMGFDKLFAKIGYEYVIEKSVNAFLNSKFIDEVILVVNEKNAEKAKKLFNGNNIKIVLGGERRQDSVKNGVFASKGDIIAIHDAARPFVSERLIEKLIFCLNDNIACAPGIIPHSTIKQINNNGEVVKTHQRSLLREIQTPQVFKKDMYLDALSKCNAEVTDDCSIMENAGYPVCIIDGEEKNIKLTTPEDFMPFQQQRIGYGYDVHKLVNDRKLIIGGVDIPYSKGLLGHSDADVLVHAIIDSLLGAASLGDIGKLFPDSDDTYLNISSIFLLSKVGKLIKENGYCIGNIDSTIVAQEPKMMPYVEKMRNNICESLGIEYERVSIKATTEEGLGFTGNKSGISATAISSLFNMY